MNASSTWDIQYDGPDVESEASGRWQQSLMGATMVLDALSAAGEARGRAGRTEQEALEAGTLAGNQQIWRDTPTGPALTELDDAAIARRWVACAEHPGEAEAGDVRAVLEAELDRRDPDTMRDYRSWRNATAMPPGEAMQRALGERDARLRPVWEPLTGPGAAAMNGDEVLERWAAAHAAHGLDGTTEAVDKARTAGGKRLAELDPTRAGAWQAMQAAQPAPGGGPGSRPGASPAQAAAHTAGKAGAFLPNGPDGGAWAAVAKGGVSAARAATRTTAAVNPVLAVGSAAASAAQKVRHAMSAGIRQ